MRCDHDRATRDCWQRACAMACATASPVPGEMAHPTRRARPNLDRQLGKSRYLARDAVTAADLFLAPVLFYFPDIPELRAIGDSAPNCARWAREMAARPSVVATEPADKPRLAA
jgi:glutathione S-transferase